jgi:branched-chain amino acid transport system permease protein
VRNKIILASAAGIIIAILAFGANKDLGPNPFVIGGITFGAVYGLIALGLVLVYKGTRVFNFAQGEFGTMAAFIVYVLIEQVKSPEIPYGIAAAIAVIATVGIGLIMERTVVRPLLNAPRITLLVATIAFALLLVGVQIMLFLPEAKTMPPIADPRYFGGIELFLYQLTGQHMLVIAVLIGFGVALAYFFSRTDLGLAVLATSQDEFATRVVGIGVERMSRFIWGSAAFLGAIAGVLYVPLVSLAPAAVTSGVLIAGFTAAVIGGMNSLPGAFLGGILVGVIEGLVGWAAGTFYIGNETFDLVVPGAPQIALVVVLLIVLLVRPQGLLGQEA